MAKDVVEATQLDRQGRVVVPARVRAAAGSPPGTPVAARASRGRVILESLDAIERRLWSSATHARVGDATADLLVDRRREVEKGRER